MLIVSSLVTDSSTSAPLAPDSLAGKRALVTGSSRGIGADTAGYFAKQAGATVVINYSATRKREH